MEKNSSCHQRVIANEITKVDQTAKRKEKLKLVVILNLTF